MASQITEVVKGIARVEQKLDDALKRLDDAEDTLYGNGTPGLKTRVDRLEVKGGLAAGGLRMVLSPLLSAIIAAFIGGSIASGCSLIPLASHETHDATAIAHIETEIPTARVLPTEIPTPTATHTATPFYVEVTPRPTDTPAPTKTIIEVSPIPTLPVPRPGEVIREEGRYTPYKDQPGCVAPGCKLALFLLPAGREVTTHGITGQGRELWLCMFVGTDTHGADECEQAVMWLTADGKLTGKYVTEARR